MPLDHIGSPFFDRLHQIWNAFCRKFAICIHSYHDSSMSFTKATLDRSNIAPINWLTQHLRTGGEGDGSRIIAAAVIDHQYFFYKWRHCPYCLTNARCFVVSRDHGCDTTVSCAVSPVPFRKSTH